MEQNAAVRRRVLGTTENAHEGTLYTRSMHSRKHVTLHLGATVPDTGEFRQCAVNQAGGSETMTRVKGTYAVPCTRGH